MSKPKILVFASGTAEGGGSGFENLVDKMREGILNADIVGVVSNHKEGGVAQRAARLKIPFFYFGPPWSGGGYVLLMRESGAGFFVCSGWLKLVRQLDPRYGINIHPGPLPTFGGSDMHGHRVHTTVMGAYKHAVITHSAVCMHFVTARYDEGPCFFRHRIPILPGDTPETLGKRVNQREHRWQPEITNLVVHREITWDGKDPESLRVPQGYEITRTE